VDFTRVQVSLTHACMPVASAFGTFVRQQYSDDLWRALAQKWDGCLGSQSFTSLLEACQELVGQDAHVMKHNFGRHFIASSGGLARLLSPSLCSSFLDALSRLSILSQGYPGASPDDGLPIAPYFRLDKVHVEQGTTSVELHYDSAGMPGTRGIVEGAVQELACSHFGEQEVKMEWLCAQAGTDGQEVWRITFPTQPAVTEAKLASQQQAAFSSYSMDPSTFHRLHPFHFVMDNQCRIIQAGSVLQRELFAVQTGVSASNAFELQLPHRIGDGEGHWTFGELAQFADVPVVLQCRAHPLKLRGQFVITRLSPPSTPMSTNSEHSKSSPTSRAFRFAQKMTQKMNKNPSSSPRDNTTPLLPYLQNSKPHHPIQHERAVANGSGPKNTLQPTRSSPLPPVTEQTEGGAAIPSFLRAYAPAGFKLQHHSSSSNGNSNSMGSNGNSSSSSSSNGNSHTHDSSHRTVQKSPLSPYRSNLSDPQLPTGNYFGRTSLESNTSSSGQVVLLFMGSPCMPSCDALQAAGVSISDLPASERCFELALMVEQLQHTIGMTAKLQEEKAALQARITQLEQQQAGHEEEVEKLGRTKQKMEQALEEALAARDSTSKASTLGLTSDTQRRRSSIRVLTPAEKAISLLDKLLHGEEPAMHDIMDVREEIVEAAGRDLHNPVKLMDQMAAKLSHTGLGGDEEVQASLKQMLAAGETDTSLYDELVFNDASELPADLKEDLPSIEGPCCIRPSVSQKPRVMRRNRSSLGPGEAMSPSSSRGSRRSSFRRGSWDYKAQENIVGAAAAFLRDEGGGDANRGKSEGGAPAKELVQSILVDAQRPSSAGDGGADNSEVSFGMAYKGAMHGGVSQPRQKGGPKKERTRQSMMLLLKPPEGVQQLLKPPTDPVMAVLAKVDDWHFDAFELAEVTNNRPLSTLAFALFSRSKLIPRFEISEVKLARFLVAIEDGYNTDRDNPYHNRTHACDVLRTLHVIMTRGGVKGALSKAQDVALMAAYLAAVIHDYEHKGYNNDFLVKTKDPLAIRYNDRSPMENHHLAAAFQMLLGDKQCSAFANTNQKVQDLLRKMVVDLVLATDMKQHFSFTSLFNTKIPLLLGSKAENAASSNQKGKGPRPSPPTQRPLSMYRARPTTAGRSRQDSTASYSVRNAASTWKQLVSPPPGQGAAGGAAGGAAAPAGRGRRRSVILNAAPTMKERSEGSKEANDAACSSPREQQEDQGGSKKTMVIDDEELRMLVLQVSLKVADLGHLTHLWEVHKRWVEMLEEEVFRQGDAEKERGLPVSPLMDRSKAGISKSQGGFFSIVVLPQLQSFCRVFPECSPFLQQAQRNLEMWLSVT